MSARDETISVTVTAALIYQDKKSRSLLHRTPIGVCGAQIFGNDPSVMAEGAALALEASGADFIDINMGCPMPKIVNNGDGSALMKDPEKAARIVEADVYKRQEMVTFVPFAASCVATATESLGWILINVSFISPIPLPLLRHNYQF